MDYGSGQGTGYKNGEGTERQLVIFQVCREYYAVDVTAVYEIIRMQLITRVPGTPSFVVGITNIRGKIVPVIDIRKRLGFSEFDQSKDNRIMVVDNNGQKVGMVVDAVTEVLRVPFNSIEIPQDTITTRSSDFMIGIAKQGDRMIILLDIEKLLSDEMSIGYISSAENTGLREINSKVNLPGKPQGH